jgi:hypothetical protein
VSQEECARLREGVPCVKVHRYNPKHLCPKLNGYGENGQRKVWSSGGSTHCTCQLTSLICVRPRVSCHITAVQLVLFRVFQCSLKGRWYERLTHERTFFVYSAWNTKDYYDMSASVFVVHFSGLMPLTS